MGKEGLIWLYCVCAIGATLGFGVGVGNMFSCGAGWIVAGICCVIAIPCGVEFNNRFIKDQ